MLTHVGGPVPSAPGIPKSCGHALAVIGRSWRRKSYETESWSHHSCVRAHRRATGSLTVETAMLTIGVVGSIERTSVRW